MPDMNIQNYSQTINDLKAAGVGAPNGRLFHVVTTQSKGMLVTDVWESEEKLNEFAKTLMPILIKNGVQPATPTFLSVHNIIKNCQE